MQNYLQIQQRMATILGNLSTDLVELYDSFLVQAQVEAEDRHVFKAMEQRIALRTVQNSHTLALQALPANTIWLPIFHRANEGPSVVTRRESVTATDAAGSTFFINDPADDDAFTIEGPAGYDWIDAGFSVGAAIEFSGFTGGLSVLNGRAGSITSFAASNQHAVVAAEDSDISAGLPAFNAGATVTRTDAPAEETLPLDWISGDDVHRYYGQGQVAGRPRHIEHASTDNDGIPTFRVYPIPDGEGIETSGAYEILVPCGLSLLSDRTQLANQPASLGLTNFFTTFGARYLLYRACAEAYLYDEDDAMFAKFSQLAERELRRLIRLDKRSRVHATHLSAHYGAATGRRDRIPRFTR